MASHTTRDTKAAPAPTTVTAAVVQGAANYLNRLRRNRRDVSAMLDLANTLSLNEIIILPDGRATSGRELYVEAISINPSYSWPYISLARRMSDPDGDISLRDGRTMSRRDLVIEAVHLDPRHGDYYGHLAWVMRKSDVVKLRDGRRLTRNETVFEAMRLMPHIRGYLYTLLGHDGSVPVALPDGRTLSPRQLLLAGYHLSPDDPFTIVELARTVSPDKRLQLPSGSTGTRQDLLVEALARFPSPSVYTALASTLRSHETIALLDGRNMDREQLWSLAVGISTIPAYTLVEIEEALQRTKQLRSTAASGRDTTYVLNRSRSPRASQPFCCN
jgi:hypothetical protein